MGLKLLSSIHLELRWFWEEAPSGEPLRLRDPDAARHFVASLCAHPAHLSALRRFVHEGATGLWSAPTPVALVERLAMAIATGRVRVARIPEARLTSWGGPLEEAEVLAFAPRVDPVAPVEEICWPCLRAAASARALREASADGSPFVAQD